MAQLHLPAADHQLPPSASPENYVDSLPPKEKVPLLIDDEHFKQRVVSLLSDLDSYYTSLCCVLRLLHPIAAAAPEAPLGRQLWSLLSLGLNGVLSDYEEFEQVMQHLNSVSREELLTPLPSAICALSDTQDKHMVAAGDQLQVSAAVPSATLRTSTWWQLVISCR
ncbi:hypothetical protein FHG87_007810 [Trinorchestia longiramus]|nr:hypothetical protein FHG87_007810 [Trinorchestia longiramus]